MNSVITFIFLILSLALVIKSADFAIHYATRLAESCGLSKYLVGFLVVAVISILPETFISVTSALNGVPSFGLGTLFGSNVADLTLVFSLVILVSNHDLRVASKIIQNGYLYIGTIFVPILLGLDGHYSRLEGMILLLVGGGFYYYILKNHVYKVKTKREKFRILDILFLFVGMALLLLGSYLTVQFGVHVALDLRVSPVLIGMFVVALGTTLPELFFSIRVMKHRSDGLALGDILGTVIADATIVVGIITLINPFSFNQRIVYISGIFMFFATVLLFHFMKTGKKINRQEAFLLILFYLLFVSAELLINS